MINLRIVEQWFSHGSNPQQLHVNVAAKQKATRAGSECVRSRSNAELERAFEIRVTTTLAPRECVLFIGDKTMNYCPHGTTWIGNINDSVRHGGKATAVEAAAAAAAAATCMFD